MFVCQNRSKNEPNLTKKSHFYYAIFTANSVKTGPRHVGWAGK